MKYKAVFICIMLSLVISLDAISQQFISVKGKEITGTDGKPFLMKGINLGNWLQPEGYMFKLNEVSSPRLINELITELIGPDEAAVFWQKYLDVYITQADIHYLKSLGMNSIRIPFNYRLFTDEDYMGGRGEARGFMLLDRVINWCKQEGLFVILDMHAAPGGQTGHNIDDSYGYPFLYESEANRDLTVQIWSRIADHYKNETIVMGYDLLNEPIPHFYDTAKFNPMLEPLYKKIVHAVREKDKNHLIFLGGAQWDSNFDVFGPPFDSKLVYQFHKYWTATTKDVIQSYLDFRDKYNVPIYCGETGENDDDWVLNFRKTLEQNNVGWHFWPYKKLDNTAGIVTFAKPQYYDEIIKYADTSRAKFDEIRKARPANMEQIKQALNGFLENCTFKNCLENTGYIKALGLVPGK